MAPLGDSSQTIGWYCVRTRRKCEHLAAAHLQHQSGLQAYCPRFRHRKLTTRGPVWFVEAMFPGYAFTQCRLSEHLRLVNATPAVLGLVRFGESNYPQIPGAFIEQCRQMEDEAGFMVPRAGWQPGDEVEVLRGPARGLESVITQILPGKDRVRILIEFLGQPREVELDGCNLGRKA